MRSAGASRSPLPAEWIAAQRARLGAASERLIGALNDEAPVSIRLNPLKPVAIQGEPVPWCTNGRFLRERPVFTLDPLFHAGCYYVQEASSMFLEQAVQACGLCDRPILALDLCAAPGGKSTHLLALLHPGSLLVSNEVVRARQAALTENLWKWGAPDSVITASPAEDFAGLGEVFDLIMVDAPCSGEGMFRKDPFAREQWSPALVRQCTLKQRGILGPAWDALKPGGTLIYSTCTWEETENEEQILRLAERTGAEVVTIPLDTHWDIDRSDAGLRFYPHRTRGEGFFIGTLRKAGARTPPQTGPMSDKRLAVQYGEVVFSVSENWHRTIEHLRVGVHVRSPGSPLGTRSADKGMEPHPAACLAVMPPGSSAFDELELSDVESLSYLRGESLPAREARGYRKVTYKGFGLGLVKGAGNRWNNLYPKPWRIRMR